MKAAVVVVTLLVASPAFAADEVLKRYMDTVLDFVGITSANCVGNYDQSMTLKARTELNFSPAEIAAYCVCSTKLLVGEMGESDWRSMEANIELPVKFAEPLKKARLACAKKLWDARRGR
jgi:hypothetical protein